MRDPGDMPGQQPAERFVFTGSGGEYFRIWIVNLLLTIVSFGIYSAWAKVRRLKYFYAHTELAGSRFDYHGNPVSILKGRMIAFGLLVAYQVAAEFSDAATLVVMLALLGLAPWLLHNAMRFRLHYSSWRGLRFSFRARIGQAYALVYGFGLLVLISFGLLTPLFRSRLKAWQHGHAVYGATPAAYDGTDGEYFAIYMRASLMSLGVLVVGIGLAVAAGMSSPVDLGRLGQGAPVAGLLRSLMGAVAGVTILGIWLLSAPYIASRTQNLVWRSTTIGGHRFRSTLTMRGLFALSVTNLLLIVVTLGLGTPWALVRTARYRADHLELLPGSPLDEFVAGNAESVGATGEGALDVFDVDVGM